MHRTRSGPFDPGRMAWGGLGALALLLALAVSPGGTAAQGWEAPRLVGPYSPLERGLLWFRLPDEEGGGEGLVATWRPRGWNPALSVRGGGVLGGEGDRGFAGVDVRAPLRVGGTAVIWTSGLGASLGNQLRITLPMQLSASRIWRTGDLWTAPFLTGGAALEWRDDGGGEVDEFQLHPVLEVGVDLTVDPRRRWTLRGGAGLVGRKGFALGLAFPY